MEVSGLPFLPTPMGKGVLPDDHPNCVAAARSRLATPHCNFDYFKYCMIVLNRNIWGFVFFFSHCCLTPSIISALKSSPTG